MRQNQKPPKTPDEGVCMSQQNYYAWHACRKPTAHQQQNPARLGWEPRESRLPSSYLPFQGRGCLPAGTPPLQSRFLLPGTRDRRVGE